MNSRRNSAPQTVSTSEIPGFRDYLVRSDIFSSCCSKDLQDDLVKYFHYRTFHTGEVLIQSGSQATTLFVLLKGNVQVVSESYEAVLAELGPGMIFGEIGALFGVPRTASVISKSNGLVAIIDKSTLKQVLGSDPVLWNHIKGIATARYLSTFNTKAKSLVQLSASEKEVTILQSDAFEGVPVQILKLLAELAEVKEFNSDEIIDFFSPREKHVLYVIKEGIVQVNFLTSHDKKQLTAGQTFSSFENYLDFAKSLCNKSIILLIDVQQAVAIFDSQSDPKIKDLGEKLFNTARLTDHVDANSSMTAALTDQISELSLIINPAQFSKRRRNSTPIFTDLGIKNSFKFVGARETIPQEVATISSKLVNNDFDLKDLLLNAGVIVSDDVTLFFDDRLTLTAIKNELTDSILLVIVSVLGAQIKVLNLKDCHLLTSLGVLAVWLHCPILEKVSLEGCWNLDDSAFSTIERCACAETIREINLSHCWRLTPKGLNFLGKGINKLDISYCKGMNDRVWPALTRFSSSLRSLRLRRCSQITDSSFEGIFGACFDELEYLDLSECAFLTDSAISTIISSAPNLRTLILTFNTSIKGSFLLHHKFLPKLCVLNVAYMSKVVNEDFCIRLAQVCGNLEELVLDGCDEVDDNCISHFNEVNLPNLKIISVNNCPKISDSVLEILNLKYN